MAQKKTVKEIKELFPNLVHKITDGYHGVGYTKNEASSTHKGTYINDKAFMVQGTGSTEEEAWQEAYEWLTRTGRYDPENNY